MSLKHHDITVDCAHCRYAFSDDEGSFDVEVPVRDAKNRIEGTARLRCTLSPAAHRIELSAWRDKGGRATGTPQQTRERLDGALDKIARHRVCGNQHICPAEIVEIAKKYGR